MKVNIFDKYDSRLLYTFKNVYATLDSKNGAFYEKPVRYTSSSFI